jgi:hypothetical protein
VELEHLKIKTVRSVVRPEIIDDFITTDVYFQEYKKKGEGQREEKMSHWNYEG